MARPCVLSANKSVSGGGRKSTKSCFGSTNPPTIPDCAMTRGKMPAASLFSLPDVAAGVATVA